MQVGSDSSGDGALFLRDSSGNNKVYLSGESNTNNYINSGNVGIGTTAPSLSGKGIHIANSGNAADIRLQRTDSGADLKILAGSSYAYVATTNAKELSFGTNGGGNRYITIDTNGNVGIGTTSPNSKVHIDGTAMEQLRMQTSGGPGSSGDTNGRIGDMAYDDDYFYIKTANGWGRMALDFGF